MGARGQGLELEPLSPTGSLVQSQGFSLQVQKVVTVQEGLCVLVPCTLSYPPIGWTEDTPALGYWFLTGTDSGIGRPVATNNPNRAVQTVPRDRFQLIGNPQNRSCSLLIREAQMEDSGWYFFRVERGYHVQYNFVRNQFNLQVTGAELTGGGASPLPCHPPPPAQWEGGTVGNRPGVAPCNIPFQGSHVPSLCPRTHPEARCLRPRDPGARTSGGSHLCV